MEEPAKWWYNLTTMKKNITEKYITPIQLKMPVDMERIIEISDPVYTFNEVMEHIDLNKYIAEEKGCNAGRPKYDPIKLLKVILFAFMEYGYCSVRVIQKLCKTDIRFLWLLDEESAPSHMTISNFMNHCLKTKIEDIFADINGYIFAQENVDLEHAYLDGTKLEANANKYSWVWKKGSIHSRNNVFSKLNGLLTEINESVLASYRVKFELRQEYAIEYVEYILETYLEVSGIKRENFVHGKGKRKSTEQKQYERLTIKSQAKIVDWRKRQMAQKRV